MSAVFMTTVTVSSIVTSARTNLSLGYVGAVGETAWVPCVTSSVPLEFIVKRSILESAVTTENTGELPPAKFNFALFATETMPAST